MKHKPLKREHPGKFPEDLADARNAEIKRQGIGFKNAEGRVNPFAKGRAVREEMQRPIKGKGA